MSRMQGSNCGLALLEASLLLLVLVPLVVGGFSTAMVMLDSRQLQSKLESSVRASDVRAARLEVEHGGFRVSVNTEEVGEHLEQAADEIERVIAGIVGDGAERSHLYRITAVYGYLGIDVQSGEPGDTVILGTVSRGSLIVPAELQVDVDPEAAMARFAAARLDDSSSPSIFAVPTGGYGAGGVSAQYLDKAVMISLSAVVSEGESFRGQVFELIGGEPLLYGTRVANLRGDI